MVDLSSLLQEANGGDSSAEVELINHFYTKLESIAQRYVKKENPGCTVEGADLVHDYFEKVKLARRNANDSNQSSNWWGQDTETFIKFYVRSIKQLLVDQYRFDKAKKRGGDKGSVTLSGLSVFVNDESTEVEYQDLHAAFE